MEKKNRALIIVDMQKDFCPGGSLAVQEGDKIVETINNLAKEYETVVLTKDWHPLNHCSFQQNGGPWPPHCVENTRGAELVDGLKTNPSKVILKGTHKEVDSYSGFYDNNHEFSTGLSEFLIEKKIEEVDVVGLALNYCVKYTALDAVEEGLSTRVILEGTRGIGDCAACIKEMQERGIEIIKKKERAEPTQSL